MIQQLMIHMLGVLNLCLLSFSISLNFSPMFLKLVFNSLFFHNRFLDLLYNFLDGAIDGAKYEDECRTVLGTWSFPVFTLDKLIDKLTKLVTCSFLSRC